MSVTSGFFNSFNGDRLYDAEQISSMFDGVIIDGVFSMYEDALAVSASSGTEIIVAQGRAWFNHVWVLNDSGLILDAGESEVLLNRYDAVVIEIDRSEFVRAGSIKIVSGTPAAEPIHPEMVHTTDINQYPLAYIYRAAGSSVITNADITEVIGTSECPYASGAVNIVPRVLLLDMVYPIGSIYMSANNVSPTAFLGGTWAQIEDRFLLAAGTSHAAGSMGGEETHRLTIDEMPSHSHYYGNGYPNRAVGGTQYATATGSDNDQNLTRPVGGNIAHNNMPPYLTVYMWKRIA